MIKKRSTREILISALNCERKKLVKRLDAVKANQHVPLDKLFEARGNLIALLGDRKSSTISINKAQKKRDELDAICDKRLKMDSCKLLEKQAAIEFEIKTIDEELNAIEWRFYK